MRWPSRSTGLVTVLCNRNGLASYDICVYVSGGALVVHDGQKTLKGNKDDYWKKSLKKTTASKFL